MSIVVPKSLHIRLHRSFVYIMANIIASYIGTREFVIAGSYKRGCNWCNDIDLVVPDHLVNKELDSKLSKIGFKRNFLRKDRPQVFSQQFLLPLKFLFWKKIIVLDIMPYNKDNLGNVLLFSTGPAKANDTIRRMLPSQGWRWSHPTFFENVVSGSRISFSTEKEALNFIKLNLGEIDGKVD